MPQMSRLYRRQHPVGAILLGSALSLAAQIPSRDIPAAVLPFPNVPTHVEPPSQPGHLFRYIMGLPTGDADFRGELPSQTVPSGPYYKVVKDDQGRVVLSVAMRGNDIVGTTMDWYPGASKWANLTADYDLNGNLLEITPMRRDAEGHIVRWEHRSPDGKLGGFTDATWTKNHATQQSFDANGKLGGHSEFFYGASGFMSGRAEYAAPGSDAEYSVQTVDEQNGLVTEMQQYRDGKLLFTTKIVHAPDGSLSRRDTYTTAKFLAIIEDFDNGEMIDRRYQYPSGDTRELRYFYDQTRQRMKTEISFDGALICTLAYTYDTPATVKTTAYGPDGSLWAKYPSPGVLDLDRNGQPPGRTDGIIYKKGNWW